MGATSKLTELISVHFQGKQFNITVIQVYEANTDTKEGTDELFYDDLQDLLELTPKKYVHFIKGDRNAKVESQELPRETSKFGLRVQSEVGKRLTEYCQENTLVIANTFF